MTPADFLVAIGTPNSEEALAAQHDVRPAVNAILTLDALAGIIHAHGKVAGLAEMARHARDDGYREGRRPPAPSTEESLVKPPRLLEPRCISASEAASYCGLSLAGFRVWVARGTLPGALPGTRRWDRHAIDAALDRLSGIVADIPNEEDDLERWMREREAKEAAMRNPDLRGPPWRRVPK